MTHKLLKRFQYGIGNLNNYGLAIPPAQVEDKYYIPAAIPNASDFGDEAPNSMVSSLQKFIIILVVLAALGFFSIRML